jgi:predicted phosphodiesterase/biotin operon repressor
MKKLLNYLKQGKSFSEMASRLKMSEEEVKAVIVGLQLDGYKIELFMENGEPTVRYNPLPREETVWQLNESVGNQYHVFVISDTHGASKWDAMDVVEDIFETADKKGVKTILHTGDITDGYYTNRGNHVHELKAIGATEQAEYMIENYPKHKDIKTYFLQGNHDFTHIRNGGTDVGKMISDKRKDMVNLGFDLAELQMGKTKIRLFHPTGGRAYAESYKAQKYIDAIPGGEKPHLYFQGHFHSAFYMLYRNIHAYSVPGLQRPTPYTVAKGIAGIMGYWDIEFENDKDGNVVNTKNELNQYHEKSKHKTLVKRRQKK